MRSALIVLAVIAALLSLAPLANAQQYAPLGVTRGLHPQPSVHQVQAEGSSRVVRAANGALIGAAFGAAVGAASAFIATRSVQDHSEDGIAYLFLITAGTAIGLVAGAVVGALGGS